MEESNIMKKLVSTIIEILAYEFLLIKAAYMYPDRFESGISLFVVCVSIGIAIVFSKAFEYAFQHFTCKNVVQSKCICRFLGILLCVAISFGLFFASFSVTERIGMLPAATRTLLILSSLSAVTHIVISKVLDRLVGVKQVCFSKKVSKYNCDEKGS